MRGERGWYKEGIRFIKQKEYKVIIELSGRWLVKGLCQLIVMNQSGFYKRKRRQEHPSVKRINRSNDIAIFKNCHDKYPLHGYRWLSAKIKLNFGLAMLNQYARRCCKNVNIVSVSKHCRYKESCGQFKVHPNLLVA